MSKLNTKKGHTVLMRKITEIKIKPTRMTLNLHSVGFLFYWGIGSIGFDIIFRFASIDERAHESLFIFI